MCLAFRILYFAFFFCLLLTKWELEPEVNGITRIRSYAYVYIYIYILCMAYLVLDLYVYVPLKPDRTGHCVTTGRWPPVRLLFFVIKYCKIFLMPIKLILHYAPDYLCYNENMSIENRCGDVYGETVQVQIIETDYNILIENNII